MQGNENLQGGGPWQFQPDTDLAPGDFYLLNFRKLRYNGKKGWFKKFLPLDEAQITNSSAENLKVTLNGEFTDTVIGNNVESYDENAFVTLRVDNIGSATVSKEDVIIAVKKQPYGADDAARQNKSEPWPTRAAQDLIPGGIPWR